MSLDYIQSVIIETVGPFITETRLHDQDHEERIRHLDLDSLPPFIMFLVYKAATISTARLSTNLDDNDGLGRLRILRNLLHLAGERWLNGGKSDESLQRCRS
jgi:hypothetical protein